MALSKVNFNSLNVTPAASKAIKFNSNNNGIETGDVGGSLVLISTQTASSSGTLAFTSGIDSTYKEYQFHFTDIHPATDNQWFRMDVSTDAGSNYNAVNFTTTHFRAYHRENGNDGQVGYYTSGDLAQSTDAVILTTETGNDNDSCATGVIHLFEPSSTTFVKHFICTSNINYNDDYTMNGYVAGYANTTSAITAVRFKFTNGNIDAGTIKLYGVV